ncbi:MAG: formate dehydrogenase accessory sulfurtransferase FdhD [Saprospiraceae bacterium]
MYSKTGEGTREIEVHEVKGSESTSKSELIAVEEPLEIRLRFTPKTTAISSQISVTMRTPGNDPELALGFLFTEGIIASGEMVEKVTPVPARNVLSEGNVLEVELKPGFGVDLKKLQRNFYTSSSCGVCGKSSIEAVRTSSGFSILENNFSIKKEILFKLPDQLRAHQEIFECTGGLHAAALFNDEGKLIASREDIGRHNAVDKVIGYAMQHSLLPLSNCLLLVSGRAGFEIVQKASMAGIPILAAVGAPSSLSYQLAVDAGITLIGFLKNQRFNVYSFPKRVV